MRYQHYYEVWDADGDCLMRCETYDEAHYRAQELIDGCRSPRATVIEVDEDREIVRLELPLPPAPLVAVTVLTRPAPRSRLSPLA